MLPPVDIAHVEIAREEWQGIHDSYQRLLETLLAPSKVTADDKQLISQCSDIVVAASFLLRALRELRAPTLRGEAWENLAKWLHPTSLWEDISLFNQVMVQLDYTDTPVLNVDLLEQRLQRVQVIAKSVLLSC